MGGCLAKRPFLDTLLVSSNFINGKLDLDNPVKTRAIKDKKGKLRRFETCLDTLTAQLPVTDGTPTEAFNRLLLRNLYALAQESAVYTEDHTATYNVRDARMAANLDWLANTRLKNEKIIVWAASSHVAKGRGSDYLVQSRFTPAHAVFPYRYFSTYIKLYLTTGSKLHYIFCL